MRPPPIRARTVLVAAFAALLSTGIALSPAVSHALAGLSLDLLTWLRSTAFGSRYAAGTSRVVLVLIDEATESTPPFNELPGALWQPQLATVLQALDAAGPRVVGLDVLLPKQLAVVPPNYERRFLMALRELASTKRLVLSKTEIGGKSTLPLPADVFMGGGLGNVRSVNLIDDPDGVVRRVPLAMPRRGTPATEPSFALDIANRAAAPKRLADAAGAQMLLNFAGGPVFRSFSFADLFNCTNPAFFAQQFRNKVVLVGSDLDFEDRHITSRRFVAAPPAIAGPRCAAASKAASSPPIARATLPGIYLHATAIDNLLRGERLHGLTLPGQAPLLVALAAIAAAIVLGPGLFVGAGLLAALAVAIIGGSAGLFQLNLLMPTLQALLACGLTVALLLGFRYLVADRDKHRIRRMFGLYLAPSVVERLVRTGQMPSLGGERRPMSFFFSDIAGFTTMAEGSDPAVLAPALNRYFDGVCAIIMGQDGIITDFIGDGVMAMFGAPIDQPDHAARALACAREVSAFSDRFRTEQRADGLEFGYTRIGVHSGEALVGNFGSTRRLKYSALGDAVNTASRLESLNKYFGTRICISEEARVAAGERCVRKLGSIRLKGKSREMTVYQLLTADQAVSPVMAAYDQAFALLERGAADAEASFAQLHEISPDDGCVAFHLARLRRGECSPLVVMEEK